jgi:hypothetical protein
MSTPPISEKECPHCGSSIAPPEAKWQRTEQTRPVEGERGEWYLEYGWIRLWAQRRWKRESR